jgi:hypothetical protein
MPRLFNNENCLFQTFAVASLDSNATATATFTGITVNDYVCVLQNNDMVLTTQSGVIASVSAANTIMFSPTGASGAGTSVAQTVGVMAMVAPTSGAKGGSW